VGGESQGASGAVEYEGRGWRALWKAVDEEGRRTRGREKGRKRGKSLGKSEFEGRASLDSVDCAGAVPHRTRVFEEVRKASEERGWH
jgi:hypothetical protein